MANSSFARAYDDFRVIRKMHQKYQDILEYFRESRMPKEVAQTCEELQAFDVTYQEMLHLLPQEELLLRKLITRSKRFLSVDFDWVDDSVLQTVQEENRQAIFSRKESAISSELLLIAKTLLERMAHEKFVGAKRMNIAVMKYAMELLDKEEEREKKRKAREAKREAKLKKRPGILAELSSGHRILV